MIARRVAMGSQPCRHRVIDIRQPPAVCLQGEEQPAERDFRVFVRSDELRHHLMQGVLRILHRHSLVRTR
jgi:hypothetical protein